MNTHAKVTLENVYQEALAVCTNQPGAQQRMNEIAQKYGLLRREVWALRRKGAGAIGLCPDTREPFAWEIETVEKAKAEIWKRHLEHMARR